MWQKAVNFAGQSPTVAVLVTRLGRGCACERRLGPRDGGRRRAVGSRGGPCSSSAGRSRARPAHGPGDAPPLFAEQWPAGRRRAPEGRCRCGRLCLPNCSSVTPPKEVHRVRRRSPRTFRAATSGDRRCKPCVPGQWQEGGAFCPVPAPDSFEWSCRQAVQAGVVRLRLIAVPTRMASRAPVGRARARLSVPNSPRPPRRPARGRYCQHIWRSVGEGHRTLQPADRLQISGEPAVCEVRCLAVVVGKRRILLDHAGETERRGTVLADLRPERLLGKV